MEGSKNVGVQMILDTPDEQLQEFMLNVGIFGGRVTKLDEDGFPVTGTGSYLEDLLVNIPNLQRECWKKFNTNPQISTAISDNAGTVCGKGFSISSPYPDVRKLIKTIVFDARNRLFSNLKKFYTRSDIEGELFLAFTVHKDGFVEVDFMHPEKLKKIHFHPSKSTFPMFYEFEIIEHDKGAETVKIAHIPSIYTFEFPSLIPVMEKMKEWKDYPDRTYRRDKRKFKKTGGYQTFIVSWDRSLFTERNVSQMSTTVEWANHYENLKRYEIDHKRSSGAYLWTVSFEDVKAFKRWISLSEEERAKTGIMQKKTPGGTLVMPPGMKLEVKNPQLSKISEADTDIMHMITSGLSKPEDMVTGQNSGTYGSVKASRGPESDRNSNRKYDWEVFLRYDFFKYIFMMNAKFTDLKLERKEEIVEDFKEGKPVFSKEEFSIWETMEITFPSSEVSDLEGAVKALMGVKHGSLSDTLGIPLSTIAERLGLSNYRTLRAKNELEKKKYPELVSASDVDSDVIDGSTESKLLEKKKSDKTGEEKKKDEKQK